MGNKIEELNERYNNAKDAAGQQGLIPEYLDLFLEIGKTEFVKEFWEMLEDDESKLGFIKNVYNYIKSASMEMKMQALEVLSALFFASEGEVQFSINAIMYAALFDKHSEELNLFALDFYIRLWESPKFNEELRNDIFPRMLDVIDNNNGYVGEQAIYKIIKLKDRFTEREVERFRDAVVDAVLQNKNGEIKRAGFEVLKELINVETPQQVCKKILEASKSVLKFKEKDTLLMTIRLLLIMREHFSAEDEKLIAQIFEKFKKDLVKSQYITYFDLFYEFLIGIAFIDPSEFLRPFLKMLNEKFKIRDELDEVTKEKIENIVNWIWDNYLLTEKERAIFY